MEVEFTGVNFDSTATFSTHRGLTLTNPQDAGPGKVRATLTLPLDSETGQLSFFVQNAGARSNYAQLTVSALRPAPQLTGFFPNYAAAGARGLIQAVGTGFVAGAMVVPEIGSDVPLAGDTVVLSSNLLQQEVIPSSASGQQFLLVDSMRRPSISKAFHCEAATFAGPRIRSIRPSTLVAGALNQVEITWENVTSATVPGLIGAPSEDFPQTLLAGSAVLPVSERPASDRSIAVLDVPQTPVNAAIHVAARTASGHHTNLYEVNLTPPNPAKPFISRALVGRAPRGAEVIDTVVGERLSTAFRIQFYPPKFDAEIIASPTNTSLQMRVTRGPMLRWRGIPSPFSPSRRTRGSAIG